MGDRLALVFAGLVGFTYIGWTLPRIQPFHAAFYGSFVGPTISSAVGVWAIGRSPARMTLIVAAALVALLLIASLAYVH